MKQQSTLFVRTSLTMFVALFIFMAFSAVVVFQNLMQPLARQGAGDLAALMVLSAQTWAELSHETRPRFESELKNYHGIRITEKNITLKPFAKNHPFFRFLKVALEERLEEPVEFFVDENNGQWIWIDISMSDHLIHVGFPLNHIEPDPPRVIFLLLIGAALLIFLTSSFLVRKLTKPLEKLSQATLQMGRGIQVPPLKETGAKELTLLARSFNQMNERVQHLLDNRDTLFAGISHDLRTPISRIYLALELMESESDPELLNSVRSDLDEINQLIGQTLELASSQKRASEKLELVDINQLITSEINKFKQNYPLIEWLPGTHCEVEISQTALQRILQNLLENAIRYGNNLPINVNLKCSSEHVEVCVSDQGKGIPEEHQSKIFQPFFRLETSRNINTGGSGLGLTIVSQLCEIYGWTIQLQSGISQGCTFCLTIK